MTLADTVQSRLDSCGINVDVRFTAAHGDATRYASEAASAGYDAVIAAGGDGTVNEVARALRDTATVLGILPVGSGNGLARHLDIPLDPVEALAIIERGRILKCDYGTVNDLSFFCTFGVGFDAAVSEKFARQKRRGKLSYVKSAVEEYINYSPQTYAIEVNGVTLTQKAFLIAVCNASQYGNNAYIAPDASMSDGLLDVTIVHAGNRLETASVGIDLFTGFINRNARIHTLRTSRVVITRSVDGPAHIDGEPVTMADTMNVVCHPGGLQVFTSGELRFRPVITPVTNSLREIRSNILKLMRPLFKL